MLVYETAFKFEFILSDILKCIRNNMPLFDNVQEIEICINLKTI